MKDETFDIATLITMLCVVLAALYFGGCAVPRTSAELLKQYGNPDAIMYDRFQDTVFYYRNADASHETFGTNRGIIVWHSAE